MTRNQILIGIVSIVTIFGFLIGAYVLTNKPQVTTFPEVNKITSTDHVKWATDSAKAKNILVEYSDLQCPACKSFHDIMKSEIEPDNKITENITFVYRHFPLVNTHKNAQKASYAAEAAGKQGKFYEFVDLMFAKQNEWANADDMDEKILTYAAELKLDSAKFKEDVNSSDVKDHVTQDMASGNAAEVNSTPTFYLNGAKLELTSLDQFKQLLSETLPK